MAEPVSRTRREITEITHIAPIKAGLVPVAERGPNSAPITYADRLKIILEAFNRREESGFPSVIRMFRGIHVAQWTLLDGDTRLMLHVVFDGDWYDYLRSLTLDVPAFLNLIWGNCEGWEKIEIEDPRGDEKLFKFIKAYQSKVSFLYATYPELTVRDVAWLQELRDVVQQLPAEQREGILAKMDTRLATATFDGARTLLLQKRPPQELQAAQQAFRGVIGKLYNAPDAQHTFDEAFGTGGARAVAPAPKDPTDAELQSNLFRSYPSTSCARMYVLRFTDAEDAGKWLASLQGKISYSSKALTSPLHLALSFAGLQLLAPRNPALAKFPEAFRQGMRKRATRLADQYPDANEPPPAAHAILTLHVALSRADDAALLDELEAAGAEARDRALSTGALASDGAVLRTKLRARLDGAEAEVLGTLPACVTMLQVQDLHHPLVRVDDGKFYGVEHFGFREGSAAREGREASLPEVVLTSDDPALHEGSFLVIRQLEQDVGGFWDAMGREAKTANSHAVTVGELAMGATREGERLARCPAQAHVHRVNPTPELGPRRSPRMIRRGMPYRDAHGYGLMFMVFVKDIEAQFEFVQRHWVQSANHVGGTSKDRDVVAGQPYQERGGTREDARSGFSSSPWVDVAAGKQRAQPPDLAARFQQFVTLRWGEYFFVPSRNGLASLLGAEPPGPRNTIAAKDAFASQLEASDPDQQRALVRGWLDDATLSTAFWRWAEARGGYRIPAGKKDPPWVFAAHPRDSFDVMKDDGKLFSVVEYEKRMVPTTGRFFLGLDTTTPDYLREAPTEAIIPNHAGAREDVRTKTRDFVFQFLRGIFAPRIAVQRLSDPSEPARFRLVELLARTLDQQAASWFGVSGPSVGSLAAWGLDIAGYHFRVASEDVDLGKVRVSATDFRAHVSRLVQRAREPEPTTSPRDPNATIEYSQREKLREVLATMKGAWKGCPMHPPSDEDLVRNLMNIITGSLGASIKLFSGALLGYAALSHTPDGYVVWPKEPNDKPFDRVIALTAKTLRRGGPDSLYRKYVGTEKKLCRVTDREGREVDSKVSIEPGDIVVTWLGGALEVDAMGTDFLFGAGDHQCPGMAMAKGMMDGILDALYPYELKAYLDGGDPQVELSAKSFQQLVGEAVKEGHLQRP